MFGAKAEKQKGGMVALRCMPDFHVFLMMYIVMFECRVRIVNDDAD